MFNGVDFSAVVSLDATRAIPTWRADESIFRLLLKLRESTEKEVLVQTRTDVDDLLTHATRGALERFYDEEIDLRKALSSPPFSRFILLTWTGPAEAVKETRNRMENLLGTVDVEYYFNPSSTKQKAFGHALLRCSDIKHPKQVKILEKIKSLPPHIRVEVNPDRII